MHSTKIKKTFAVLVYGDHVNNKKYGNFESIPSLTGEWAAEKILKTFAVLVYGHVYIIWSY